MFKRVFLALPLVLMVVSCGGCADSAAPVSQDSQPLRIGWVYAMANAPVPVAESKGFYEAESLKVKAMSFAEGPKVMQAVAAGELDVAYVGIVPVYQWAARGLEARVLAKVNHGQAAVIAGRESSIEKVADLRGKKLAGVTKGSGMDVLLREFVLKDYAHFKPDDVSIVEIPPGNMNAAVERGVVDAAFSWEPFVSQSLLRGSTRLVLAVNEVLPGYPWYVVMARTQVLQERPEDIVRLLRAHQKAIDFLNEHPDESNQLIAAAFKLEQVQSLDGQPISPESIVAEARKRLGWSSRLEDSDRQFIERFIGYSLKLGYMEKPIDLAQLVDESYLQRATH